MTDFSDKQALIDDILRLKKEKDAVILAHSYQPADIQEIADVVGDSFALSKYCTKIKEKTLVFCGVHFMAESAKILSPEKTVLIPEKDAGCPMADMVTAPELRAFKEMYPDAAVVSCTAGYECYLPVASDFPKGGYESESGTVWAPDTGDNVIVESIKALKNFKA